MTKTEIKEFLLSSHNLIPSHLKISNLNWKNLCCTVLEGGNVLIKGESGGGKTLTTKTLKQIFPNREFISIPMSAAQDARSTLIGNAHFKDGTFFKQSAFTQAIQIPNTIIILEEVNRSHKDIDNILSTVLDPLQKFLRIDDDVNIPVINVADGVSFIATANIGRKYTSTRAMDFSFTERFVEFEMDTLDFQTEYDLSVSLFSDIDEKIIKQICEIADYTRELYFGLDSDLTRYISTKLVHKFLSRIDTGAFTFDEALKSIIYPKFENDDLNIIKLKVQSYET